MNTSMVVGFIIMLTLGTLELVYPDLYRVVKGQEPTVPPEIEKEIEDAIPEGLKGSPRGLEIFRTIALEGNASLATPDMAKLLIFSDTGWSAHVLDSGLDSFDQDGSHDSVIDFECMPGFMSTYSVSVQKDTEAGYVLLFVVQNFRGLDAGGTKAEYGIASLAGECGKPPTSE
jgi:hypothetical protein